MAATNYLVLKPYRDPRGVHASPGMVTVFDPAVAAQAALVNSHLAGGVIMLSSGAATSTHPIAVAVTKMATAGLGPA